MDRYQPKQNIRLQEARERLKRLQSELARSIKETWVITPLAEDLSADRVTALARFPEFKTETRENKLFKLQWSSLGITLSRWGFGNQDKRDAQNRVDLRMRKREHRVARTLSRSLFHYSPVLNQIIAACFCCCHAVSMRTCFSDGASSRFVSKPTT